MAALKLLLLVVVVPLLLPMLGQVWVGVFLVAATATVLAAVVAPVGFAA